MNVTCNKCGKRYVIADEKVAGKASAKIRCKQCQNLIQLAPGAAASLAMPGTGPVVTAPAGSSVTLAGTSAERRQWDDEATRAMPAPDMTPKWFAMIAGKQEGPFDLRALGQKAGVGEVTLRTYLWKPGMDNWKRAADVPDVSAVFAAAPGKVSSGASATATGPMQASLSTQRPSRGSGQRDVAVANELPAGAEFATASQIISAPSGLEKPEGARSAGATAGTPGPTAGQAPLNDLFNDVHDSASSNGQAHEGSPLGGELDDEEPTKGEADPFAALGEVKEGEAPPPGEATKFFIAQAGVNRRNPPWKIALFVLGGLGGPLAALYLLSTLHVIPQVTVVREDGEEVRENFFSPTGIGGLKDMLTGDKARKSAEAEEKRRAQLKKAAAATTASPDKPAGEKKTEVVATATAPKPGPGQPNMADLFKDDQKRLNAPKNRDDPAALAANSTGSSGLSADAAMKVVANSRKSFEGCIEAALRRSPNLAVGNITVNLTVGASGAVKAVGIEPAKWQGSDWAQCMMTAGKRIVFPSSDGDSEVQVPLKVGVTM